MPSVRTDLLYKTAWLDPSGGLKKGHGHSRWAIAIVGGDDQERIFILYTWVEHAATEYAINQFFKAYLMWRPAVFGMDATGGQILFAQQLQKEAKTRNIPVPLRPISLQGEKVSHIEHIIQPIASGGRLFRLPEIECKRLHEEWCNFPGDIYQDALDALANAIRLQPSCSVPTLRELTRDQYRRYLERSGYEPDEIRRKMTLG